MKIVYNSLLNAVSSISILFNSSSMVFILFSSKLIKLKDKLYNVNSVDCKFSATAYDLINLRTKELKTDLISGLSSLTERI